MVRHHPPTDFLMEYAAGVLPVAQSACVAAHLSYCQRCRQIVDRLEDIGGAQLEHRLGRGDLPAVGGARREGHADADAAAVGLAGGARRVERDVRPREEVVDPAVAVHRDLGGRRVELRPDVVDQVRRHEERLGRLRGERRRALARAAHPVHGQTDFSLVGCYYEVCLAPPNGV